jgi:hypothetical protein
MLVPRQDNNVEVGIKDSLWNAGVVSHTLAQAARVVPSNRREALGLVALLILLWVSKPRDHFHTNASRRTGAGALLGT